MRRIAITDVSKECGVHLQGQTVALLALLGPYDTSTTTLRNVGNYYPSTVC